ncbi:MAG TPA: DNA primase [Halanaerobiales bacterium]|nr:DNA primase [Halanaerobiales bacterium]
MSQNNGNFSEKVKDRLDIVEVVSEYVNLKKTGKNYQGLCPFHQEKTPSFTVNPDNQFYYCFGCGKGGDIFNFIMEIENVTFYESLKLLAKKANLQMPDSRGYSKEYNQKREKLFEIHQLAAKFYNYLLLNKQIGNEAFKYLSERGYTEKDLERYYIGYAPDSWHSLYNFLSKRDFADQILKESGLIGHKNNNYYDKFRDRIMFPIFNSQGEVIAFGGRRLDDEDKSSPKYYNSPETLIFHKSKNLYGINWAKKGFRNKNSAVIMEGYTDVITAHKYGINNAVASLGTALTLDQAKILKRYVDTVYIAFDPDFAGEQATLKGLDILKEADLNVRVIELPEESDPDDFIKDKGVDDFENLMESSYNLIEFKIRRIINEEEKYNINQRINRSKKVLKVLSEINDPIERDVYLNKTADILNIDKEAMQEALNSFNQKNRQENEDKNRIKEKDSKKELEDLNHQDLLLKTLIDNPERIKQAENELEPEYFQGIYRKAFNLILEKGFDILKTNIEQEVDNQKLADYFMILTVKERQEVSEEKFNALLELMKDEYKKRAKNELFHKLQNVQLEKSKLDNLLFDYHKIINI